MELHRGSNILRAPIFPALSNPEGPFQKCGFHPSYSTLTAVFGTATQPAFAAASASVPRGWAPVEISSQPKIMADALRRTRIVRRPPEQAPSWPELASEIAQHPQVLCVVNLKRHARDLFNALPPEHRFHLSSAMCPAHRQQQFAEIRRRLNHVHPEPCRLVL